MTEKSIVSTTNTIGTAKDGLSVYCGSFGDKEMSRACRLLVMLAGFSKEKSSIKAVSQLSQKKIVDGLAGEGRQHSKIRSVLHLSGEKHGWPEHRGHPYI